VVAVALGQGQKISVLLFCILAMVCMQGWYLEPILMRPYGEGPIMGLNEGLISMGVFVRVPILMSSAMKTINCAIVTI